MQCQIISYGYTSGDRIESNRDRKNIYSSIERTHDIQRMISRDWFIKDDMEDDITKLISKEEPRKNRVTWCAESIETWQVIGVSKNKNELAKIVRCKTETIGKSWKKKIIIANKFFYPKGERPSEDEIDDMLDKLERQRSELRAKTVKSNQTRFRKHLS